MAVKVKTWVWIIVSIVVVGVLFVIAMAGAGLYFFSQHISARNVSATTAASEFDSIRSQFTGQKALIELDERGNFLRSNTDRPTPANPRIPDKLYVLAFDPDDGSLVRVTIPFWLLRKVGAGDVKLLAVAPITTGGDDLFLFSLLLLVAAAITAVARSRSGERRRRSCPRLVAVAVHACDRAGQSDRCDAQKSAEFLRFFRRSSSARFLPLC